MDETASILYTTLLGGLALGLTLYFLYRAHLLDPGNKGDTYSTQWYTFADKIHKNNPTY